MLALLRRLFGRSSRQLEVEEKISGDLVVRTGNIEIPVSPPKPSYSRPSQLSRAEAQPANSEPRKSTSERRKPITLNNPACPYCGVIQEPPPQRRKKCRDCGQVIQTYTDQTKRVKYLMTTSQLDEFKKKDHERHLQEQKQFEQEIQVRYDAQVAVFNRQVIDAYKNRDYHSAKMAHFQQALAEFKRGRDHRKAAAASRQDELLYYKHRPYGDMGVTKVTILVPGPGNNGDSCEICKPLHGKSFTIDEALRLMPIPHRNCQTWHEKNRHGGWCRCSYQPVLPRN